MRILLLTHVLPYPLDSRAKVRAYYVLRHLAQTHAVTLLLFTRPSDPPEAIAHVRGICAQVRTVPLARSPRDEALSLIRSLAGKLLHTITRDDHPGVRAALWRFRQVAAGSPERRAFCGLMAEGYGQAWSGVSRL